MDESKSLRDILAIKDPRFIHAGMLLNIVNYDSFVDSVHFAIETIVINKLESMKDKLLEDEDQISDQIVNLLYCLNYNAVREASNNGNVDVTISIGEFTWLAEAKIFHDNPRLMDGFRQLTTRYSSASNLNNNKGGYLIYNFRPNTKQLIDDYKSVSHPILLKEFKSFSIEDCRIHPLRFYTLHKEEASGLDYHVKHIPFSFYYNPKDKSGIKSKANREKKKGEKVKKLQAKKFVP